MRVLSGFFALDLPHSDACFVQAYPAAVSEAWVDRHVHAFTFFGRVPKSVLYDNDRCLVAKILPDGSRKRTKLFKITPRNGYGLTTTTAFWSDSCGIAKLRDV
jgi:transposase